MPRNISLVERPVLFITGYARPTLRVQLAAWMQVIGKPFTLEQLAARIAAMITKPADSPAP